MIIYMTNFIPIVQIIMLKLKIISISQIDDAKFGTILPSNTINPADSNIMNILTLPQINDQTLQDNKEEIRMDQTPDQSNWKLIPLYKLSPTGSMSVWQIGFDGIDHLEISYGYDDGVISTDRVEIKLDTSGRNMCEQALRDARQYYKLKYREGYQPAGSTTPPLVKAMKGHEYKQNLVKIWPVYTQPGLSGVRMLCQDNGARTIVMRSVLNNPYTHLTHIENELKDFFPYLPRYCVLDGELYNHNMDFTTLKSAVKTVKCIHPRLREIQYWISDINYEDSEGTPFEKRCTLLINAFRKYIQDKSPIGSAEDISVLPQTFIIVPTRIARDHEEMLQQHAQYVGVGHDGIMIKKISNQYIPGSKVYNESLYRAGKCNHILKYKEFIDEIAIILNVTQTEETERGLCIFNVQDIRGNTFNVRMRGNLNHRKHGVNDQHSVIGKEMTIRYQDLSINGVPNIPIGIAIKGYE